MTHAISIETLREQSELIPDPRTPVERERTDAMECVRLRLLWAIAAGGDDGVCAACAVSVIRFAEEGDGRYWSDTALRSLHRRLCYANGLGHARFKNAVESLRGTLFLPA